MLIFYPPLKWSSLCIFTATWMPTFCTKYIKTSPTLRHIWLLFPSLNWWICLSVSSPASSYWLYIVGCSQSLLSSFETALWFLSILIVQTPKRAAYKDLWASQGTWTESHCSNVCPLAFCKHLQSKLMCHTRKCELFYCVYTQMEGRMDWLMNSILY